MTHLMIISSFRRNDDVHDMQSDIRLRGMILLLFTRLHVRKDSSSVPRNLSGQTKTGGGEVANP